MIPVLLFVALSNAVLGDDLVQVQVVWRHGDRTPLHCYRNDPHLPYWNQWLNGELTPTGMAQEFHQGLKLKQRYIDTYDFMNSTYRRQEITIYSSLTPRCIQSGAANLAGFYAGSQGTYPASTMGFPSGWTPMPIHSREGPLAHVLDPGHNCPRDDILTAARTDNKEFIEYVGLHAELIAEIEEKSGDPILDFNAMLDFSDCIRVEKEFNNMTLPSWITNAKYNEIQNLYYRISNYMYGEADFGVGDDIELVRIRGGPLLTEMLNNMQDAQNNTGMPKMIIYSAHDSTVSALLRTLGCKAQVVGVKNPNYAAMFAFELWKSTSGYYVKAVYAADMDTPFQVVTKYIQGCGGGDTCSFSALLSSSSKYIVHNINELCDTP